MIWSVSSCAGLLRWPVPLLALASAEAFGLGAMLLMCPDVLPGLLAVLGGGALTAAGASGLVGLIVAFCGKNK